jgi:hypothetical protein
MSGRLSGADTKARRRQRAVLELMREHERDGALPTSGRFVFYELEQRGVVSKEQGKDGERTASQDISDALMHLRERNIIPWEWVEDETRTLIEWDHAETVAVYMRGQLTRARLNPWRGPPPLVLVESRSLAGVLRNIAYGYVCPITSTNGQVGGHLHTDVGPLMARSSGDGVHRRVVYLGDHDHQGGQIEANTRRVLADIVGRELDWQRVAITAEQIAERGLTPIRKRDRRYEPARWHDAWETEALGQQTVIVLVRDALDALLPAPLDAVRAREREERAAVGALLHPHPRASEED